MREPTKEIKQRLTEWIHLCEQSMATGYATELMQEAINRIAYLESEKGDPMVEWMSAESLEMHIVRLKQNLSEQAMRVAQLQQENAALRETHSQVYLRCRDAVDGDYGHEWGQLFELLQEVRALVKPEAALLQEGEDERE